MCLITVILQGGIYFESADQYFEFYYQDPVGYDSRDQLDFNAYRYYHCSYNDWSSVRNDNISNRRKLCDSNKPNRMLNSEIVANYVPKHRIYLYEPKSRLLWVLMNQYPHRHGFVKLGNRLDSDYSQKWTFGKEVNSNHLYTGAFSFQGKVYLVEERISHFGFRYPNVLRQVEQLTNFSLNEYKVCFGPIEKCLCKLNQLVCFQMPINQFFNCAKPTRIDELKYDPDRRFASFNSFMIILFSALLAFFLLSLLVFYIGK